jgi:hypothetical protein
MKIKQVKTSFSCLLALLLMFFSQLSFAQRTSGGGDTTGTGHGTRVGTPNTSSHIVYGQLVNSYPINYANKYKGRPGANGEIQLIEDHLTYNSNVTSQGTVYPQSDNIDLYNLAPQSLLGTGIRTGGGAWNDVATGAYFSGALSGYYFEIYDSPSASKDDDWCMVYFNKDIPADKAYYLRTFEENYFDEYVHVIYHIKDGLDGKVSYIKYHQ